MISVFNVALCALVLQAVPATTRFYAAPTSCAPANVLAGLPACVLFVNTKGSHPLVTADLKGQQ